MIEYIHKIFFSSGFVDIVTIRRHFQNFLSVRKHCTCYSNPWIADSIPPCRYICQEVRRGCEPLLRLMGYTWPDEVECGRFPTQAPCLNGTGILFPSATTSTTSITSTTQTPRTIPTTTSTRTTTDLSEHHHSRTRVLGRNFWPFFNRLSPHYCSEHPWNWHYIIYFALFKMEGELQISWVCVALYQLQFTVFTICEYKIDYLCLKCLCILFHKIWVSVSTRESSTVREQLSHKETVVIPACAI